MRFEHEFDGNLMVVQVKQMQSQKFTCEYDWYVSDVDEDYLKGCEFIPANDLQWCAVNEQEWYKNYKYIYRGETGTGFSDQYADGHYTHKQWQECRYELGLDERQEDNKLKLTKGDKYLNDDGQLCEFVGVYRGSVVGVMIGHSYADPAFNVSNLTDIKPYEPLEWMDKIPPASSFKMKENECIFCSSDGHWGVADIEDITMHESGRRWNGSMTLIGYFNMPTLTGDQWKNSKCKIVDGEWVNCE